MTTMTEQKPNETNPDQLPFCAPCKKLDTLAPLNWLRLGWKDLTRAPRQSLNHLLHDW
jgi:hypothetical protein